jgi:hypothetical protein
VNWMLLPAGRRCRRHLLCCSRRGRASGTSASRRGRRWPPASQLVFAGGRLQSVAVQPPARASAAVCGQLRRGRRTSPGLPGRLMTSIVRACLVL